MSIMLLKTCIYFSASPSLDVLRNFPDAVLFWIIVYTVSVFYVLFLVS